MCGIVGYVGHGDTKEIILHGLKTLEYRGMILLEWLLCQMGKFL